MIFHSAVQQQLSVNFLFFPDDTRKVFFEAKLPFSAKYKERNNVDRRKQAWCLSHSAFKQLHYAGKLNSLQQLFYQADFCGNIYVVYHSEDSFTSHVFEVQRLKSRYTENIKIAQMLWYSVCLHYAEEKVLTRS